MRLPLIAVALLATAAAARDRAADVPAAIPAGEAVTCVPLQQIRETRVRDDRTIDFIGPRRRAWRNTLPGACPGLGSERQFGYATSIGQLCAGDLVTVLYSSGPGRGASCGLGRFQPVTLARR